MKILCLGDSLTFGFGVPRREAWTTLVQRELGVELVNAGIPGDTTGGMLARFPGELLKHRPSLLILMGGSNDIFFGGGDECARANIAAMCHQSAARGVKVVLCSPTPVDVGGARGDWGEVVDFFVSQEVGRGYAGWLGRFAGVFSIPFVDFWGEFDRRMGGGEELFVDGLHPNGVGQGIMAGMVVKVVKEAVEKSG